MPIKLESPLIVAGRTLDARFTCDGADVSPPLIWSGVPKATLSLALVMADPDASRGTFFHWAVFDIPPHRQGIDGRMATDDVVAGMRQGVNDFGRIGFSGSCPPKGDPPHRYRFRLFALKVPKLDLRERPKAAEVELRAREQALAMADLVARYGR